MSDIGHQVGFENDNYFIKIFKRWCEMTPNEFRKQGGKSKAGSKTKNRSMNAQTPFIPRGAPDVKVRNVAHGT